MDWAKFRHRLAGKDPAKDVTVRDPDVEHDPAGSPTRLSFWKDTDVVKGSHFVLRKVSRVYYFYHYVAHERLMILPKLCHKRQYDQD